MSDLQVSLAEKWYLAVPPRTPATFPSQKWTHIAFTFRAGAVAMYIDTQQCTVKRFIPSFSGTGGQPQEEVKTVAQHPTTPAQHPTARWYVGHQQESSQSAQNAFAGMLADLRLYNRALMPAEFDTKDTPEVVEARKAEIKANVDKARRGYSAATDPELLVRVACHLSVPLSLSYLLPVRRFTDFCGAFGRV
jgi:hypothetical protein